MAAVSAKDPKVGQSLDAVVLDTKLSRRVARYEAQRLLGEHEPPQVLREVKLHLEDPHDWYAGYLGVRGEYEAPYELRRDLKERVPQALLRDLFRPVMPDPKGQVERVPLGNARAIDGESGVNAEGEGAESRATPQAGPRGPRATVRAAMALLRQPLPEIISSVILLEEEKRIRQRLLRTPWQPHHPDHAPRQYASYFGSGFSAS